MPRSIALACIALIGLCGIVPLQLLGSDEAWFAFAGLGVIVTLILVIFSVAWRSKIGCAIVAIYVAAAWMLLSSDTTSLRERVRWAADGRSYKAEVLANHPSSRRQRQHAVWDAWGWGGMDTSVYLVFDPADSLIAASRSKSPGKPRGLPCTVAAVHRMEPHWYSVRFYTSEDWHHCQA
jgi:hypothetical protein